MLLGEFLNLGLARGRHPLLERVSRHDRAGDLERRACQTDHAHRVDSSSLRIGLRPPTGARAPRYLMSVSILNIGRYIEMMMMPTMIPTPIIMIGSMIEVSVWIDESTSSS